LGITRSKVIFTNLLDRCATFVNVTTTFQEEESPLKEQRHTRCYSASSAVFKSQRTCCHWPASSQALMAALYVMQFLTLCGQPTNPKASFVYHQKFTSIHSYSSPFSPSRHTNPDVYNMASSEYHKNTNKTGASLPPFCLYKVGQFPQTSFSKTTLPENFVGGIKHFEGHLLCVQNRNYI